MRLFARWHIFFGVLLLLLMPVSAADAAPTFPPLTGRVVDDANILSEATREQLTSMLAEHEKQTSNQVVVVTLKSLQGYAIEDYGYQLGRAWGIGQKGKNNGALLIVAPNEHDARIEVGYGLEGSLTDAQSKLIIENIMLPMFRKGDYDTGVLNGTMTLLRVLGGDASALPQDQNEQPDYGDNGDSSNAWIYLGVILIWLVFGRFFWPLFFLGGLGGWGGGYGGGYGRGGFGGGGFGGGGFGGGGFSGGGGSFGGGGASGHW